MGDPFSSRNSLVSVWHLLFTDNDNYYNCTGKTTRDNCQKVMSYDKLTIHQLSTDGTTERVEY